MENSYWLIWPFLTFKEKLQCSVLNKRSRDYESKHPEIYRQDYIDILVPYSLAEGSIHTFTEYCNIDYIYHKCRNPAHYNFLTKIISTKIKKIKNYKFKIQKQDFKNKRRFKRMTGKFDGKFGTALRDLEISYDNLKKIYENIGSEIDEVISFIEKYKNVMTPGEKDLYSSMLRYKKEHENLNNFK